MRRIRSRPVWRSELIERNARHLRPVALSGVEVEALRAGRRELAVVSRRCRRSAEATRRRTATIARSVFAKIDVPVGLRSLTRVERNTRRKERVRRSSVPIRSKPSASSAAIWASFASWNGCGRRCGTGSALRGRERDVADPEGDRRLRDAELGGDVLQRHVAGTHRPRPLLRLDLPAVAHGATVRRGCDSQARYVPRMGRDGTVGVGVIGRGFGQTVVAPVFDETDGLHARRRHLAA